MTPFVYSLILRSARWLVANCKAATGGLRRKTPRHRTKKERDALKGATLRRAMRFGSNFNTR
jgi:hypothetical protein